MRGKKKTTYDTCGRALQAVKTANAKTLEVEM
jgi:hypothetical protein